MRISPGWPGRINRRGEVAGKSVEQQPGGDRRSKLPGRVQILRRWLAFDDEGRLDLPPFQAAGDRLEGPQRT